RQTGRQRGGIGERKEREMKTKERPHIFHSLPQAKKKTSNHNTTTLPLSLSLSLSLSFSLSLSPTVPGKGSGTPFVPGRLVSSSAPGGQGALCHVSSDRGAFRRD